jgi:hypothetical protein
MVNGNVSQSQMSSITKNKQAMPETPKYDGPSDLSVSGSQNHFAANSGTSLPKPGFSS